MDKKEIIEEAFTNFYNYEVRLINAAHADSDIVAKQSTPRLKKLFDEEFRGKVKLEIRGIRTWDSDARAISNDFIAQVVHS